MKQRIISPPVSRSTLGFSTSVTRLRPRLLRILEGLFANVRTALHAHDARGERDVVQALFLPRLHFRIGAQRGVNRFRQREELHAAVAAFGIFAEHDLIDLHIFADRIWSHCRGN